MGSFAPEAKGGQDRRARTGVRTAGLAAGLLAVILILALGPGPRLWLVDIFQNLVPSPPISQRVHVVVLDAESLRDVGGWPWSRFYLARLIEEIAGRGAAAIGLDMLLEEPDSHDPSQFLALYSESAAGRPGWETMLRTSRSIRKEKNFLFCRKASQ